MSSISVPLHACIVGLLLRKFLLKDELALKCLQKTTIWRKFTTVRSVKRNRRWLLQISQSERIPQV